MTDKYKRPYMKPCDNSDVISLIRRLEEHAPKTAENFYRVLERGKHHPSQVIRLMLNKVLNIRSDFTSSLP